MVRSVMRLGTGTAQGVEDIGKGHITLGVSKIVAETAAAIGLVAGGVGVARGLGVPGTYQPPVAAAGLAARGSTGIRVVNVGGPLQDLDTLQAVASARSLRPDFVHVDLNEGANTIVANVNNSDLSTLVGSNVRFLRASNVPFTRVPSGAFVDPAVFVEQAENISATRIAVITGTESQGPLIEALSRGGWSVRVRQLGERTVVTATR